MKFTNLFTSSLLFSITSFVVSAAHDIVDQDNNDELNKVYVNANGDIVIPQVFPWGSLALKEKDAAKPRMCGGPVDASGRLGKRTPTCPYGYAIACDAYSANPCCSVDTPLCCIGSSVCCGTGQFCQGNSTCCNVGQIGCGEACCEYGQVCCGTNCCGTGFTCGAGNTCVPPVSYTSSTSLSSSSSVSSDTYVYSRETPIYTTDTSSNPYGYNPSYSPPPTNSTPIVPTCTAYCTPTVSPTVPPTPPPDTHTTGIVGGVLGAFCFVLVLIAGWLFWRKRHAEQMYAEVCAPKPVEEPKPLGYTPTPEPAPPATYAPTTEPGPPTTYTPAPAPAPAPAPPATYTPTPAPPATSY